MHSIAISGRWTRWSACPASPCTPTPLPNCHRPLTRSSVTCWTTPTWTLADASWTRAPPWCPTHGVRPSGAYRPPVRYTAFRMRRTESFMWTATATGGLKTVLTELPLPTQRLRPPSKIRTTESTLTSPSLCGTTAATTWRTWCSCGSGMPPPREPRPPGP